MQRFEVKITPPDPNNDRQLLDAEQIMRWLAEHRPHHEITVTELH